MNLPEFYKERISQEPLAKKNVNKCKSRKYKFDMITSKLHKNKTN